MKKINRKIPDHLIHLLALVLLPINIGILAALWIFRQLVRLWLHLALGDQFGGLLRAGDKVYAPNVPVSRKIMLTVWYIRSDEKIDVMEKMSRIINAKILNDSTTNAAKLKSTFHTFFGQDYLLKNQVEIGDLIKPIPKPNNGAFDDVYLKKLVGDLGNAPLPKNHTALWESLVGVEPLDNTNKNGNGYVYPVIYRIHHSVADGIRLVLFMSELFSNDVNYIDKVKHLKKKRKSFLHQLGNVVSYTLHLLYLVVTGPAVILNMTMLREEDESAIHRSTLSGEKLIAWTAEESIQRVTTVKKIKNQLPNTRFSEVVLSCVSASFFNYFKLKKWQVPDHMSCLIPVLFLHPDSNQTKPLELKNDYTFCDLTMPLVDPTNIVQGLENVKLSVEKMRQSPVAEVFYWLMNYICAVIPSEIMLKTTTTKAFTTSISIVPGAGRIKVFGNCDLEASISTAPHTNETGMTFTIVTYDDKFQICLFVDKAIISEQEDVQYLVNDVLRNMDILYEESLKIYQSKRS